MSKNDNTRSISANVSMRFEYNAHIEGEISDRATEEEIQRELDEVVSMAVTENGQIASGLPPPITVTRQEEGETVEGQPEKQRAYRYAVAASTHQMLHQTIEIVSDHPLTDKQIAEQAFEEAQKGSWEQGAIDQSIAIDNVTEG